MFSIYINLDTITLVQKEVYVIAHSVYTNFVLNAHSLGYSIILLSK